MFTIMGRFFLFLLPFLKEVFFKNPKFRLYIQRNKQLIVLFIVALTLFTILLFNVDMSIRQLHTHRELEVQYQTLLNKYTIMTNLYGENGSDDPNVIKDITQCYDQRKTLQNELRVKEERIRYLDSLVDVLQRQLINRCPTTGE